MTFTCVGTVTLDPCEISLCGAELAGSTAREVQEVLPPQTPEDPGTAPLIATEHIYFFFKQSHSSINIIHACYWFVPFTYYTKW